MGQQRERREDVIWSDLKLGGHLELNVILFQSWSKIRSNCKLPSIIVTNISRLFTHTTSWFIEVRHQHLKTNLEDLQSHMHILIVSKSNLKLQVFGLFLRFVRTLILNISSSEEPANSTSIHRVRNGGKLVIIFIPLQKIWRKGVDRQLKTHGSAENTEMAPKATNKFCWHMRRRNTPLLSLCSAFRHNIGFCYVIGAKLLPAKNTQVSNLNHFPGITLIS